MACCTRGNETAVHKIFRNSAGLFSSVDKTLKFGSPLREICVGTRLPSKLKELLDVLYAHASESVHVFGVRPHVSDCAELKSALERGDDIRWHDYSIYVHAAVFLNFLQCLPNPLLGHELYDEWMGVAVSTNTLETKAKLMRVCRRLPDCHQELLRQWLLVLRNTCRAVPRSHTTPVLAGHFVGPSMLWRPGAQFAAYPDAGEHAALTAVVRCLVLFLDDVWNDIDEKTTFSPRKTGARQSAGVAAASRPDSFVNCNASQFVDSLEREARWQAEIKDMIMADPPSSLAKTPQHTSSALSRGQVSRLVHTWPRCGKRRGGDRVPFPALRLPGSTAAAAAAAAERASKVATFPRRAHEDSEDSGDTETGFCSFLGEGYLYPDWVQRYPEWNLSGTELPSWAARSCFTMDLNSLNDQITRKWISINTKLYNRTLNVTTPEEPPAHNTLPGVRF
ncbi:uncharacterized protein LOC144129105 [Amblyomma americanum]